jgi:hypothetical protein
MLRKCSIMFWLRARLEARRDITSVWILGLILGGLGAKNTYGSIIDRVNTMLGTETVF